MSFDDSSVRRARHLATEWDAISLLEGLRPAWHRQAACLGMDPELFFPVRGNSQGVRAALAVCAGCPVREECLQAGMMEKQGVWGGTAENQRHQLRRTRPAT